MIDIYALCDPDTNRVRYIGKADDANLRFKSHIWPSNLKKKRPCSNWIRGLLKINKLPILIIIERVDDEILDWKEREKFWIDHYRKSGVLLNILDGGDGGATYGRLGKPWSDEHRKNYNASRVGVSIKRSEQGNKNRGIGIKKAWEKRKTNGFVSWGQHTEETKEKLRKAHSGKKLTEEHKQKLRLAKLGKKYSAEHRKKISKGNLGKPKSVQARNKQSEGMKIAWARKREENV